MSWIKDLISPKTRQWEDFYRNRWQHDKVVRSTHGANCTGGCSWMIHVKNGIVVWETQALDYPIIDKNLPPYEPRGCQRGISASWYLYSPVRVKYPLVRGALLDIFREEKNRHGDAMTAWENIQNDPEKRNRYLNARGKGGLRRVSWDEALEIISIANISTVKKYGPDRLVGFSPIPAMSMIPLQEVPGFCRGWCKPSFLTGLRFAPRSPKRGEQTDVAESADWYNAKFIAACGSNVAQTRTPDVISPKHAKEKQWFFPRLNAQEKADEWIPIHAGRGAF